MSDYGISGAAHQDSNDPNDVVEGTAITRVEVSGRKYTVLGGAWYVRVCTGDAGEKFWGLAASEPDLSDEFAVYHEGIRIALPDLDGEGNPIDMDEDDPLTHIGVTTPGTLLVWDPAVNTADELDGFLERDVDQGETGDEKIRVRLGIR